MATEELLTRLLGKLDELDIRTEKLADSTESRFDAFGKILLDVRKSKKRGKKVSDDENYDSDDSNSSKEKSSKIDDRGIKLDDFTGLGSPEEFLEWERQVEKISEYKGFDDKKRFKIATIRLTKNAGLWFDNLKARRARSGKEKILTWTTLKKKLRAKYLPDDYEQVQYLKLTSLSQDNMSVSEYMAEFDKLCLICDVEEEETKKIGRFIRGLNWHIYKRVKLSSYHSFDDVCNLALKIEYHLHGEEEEKPISTLQSFVLAKDTQAEEESVKEEVVLVNNDVDLLVAGDEPNIKIIKSFAQEGERVSKEATMHHEKSESYDEHVLVKTENLILTPTKFVSIDIDEKEEVFEIEEFVNEENKTIMVEHIDFLGIDNLLKASTSSKYHILSRLLPKVLVMGLKFVIFKFFKKSNPCVLILKYYRTRGRVFFKGEENDVDQGMNMLIGTYLMLFLDIKE